MTNNYCTRCGRAIGAYCPGNAKHRVILGCDDCKAGEIMSQEGFMESYMPMLAPNRFFDEREI